MPPAAAVGIALAATVIGTGVSIAGNIQQGKQQKAAAEFNAKVAENEAERVEQERGEDIRRLRIRNRRLKGTQRAAIAKAGVIETGSPLELMAETAGELELQVLDVNRASLAKQQRFRTQADISRFQGAQLATGSQFAAIGAGFAGASRGASILSAPVKTTTTVT